MSKRVNNIFLQKVKFRKVYEAYRRASILKHKNKEVILFEMDLAQNLYGILKDLYFQKYRPGIYRKFTVYEPKKREIMALPFRDRVVQQWYVEEFIRPIFIPKLIVDTYACIPGRGLHHAVQKLQLYMQKMKLQYDDYYILKCDVSKFFNNIHKDILYKLVARKVKDPYFLECTKHILFDGTYKIGIPIGNYTSQFFANIYLNELDHYVKEKMRIKYYVRYMDDFILLLPSKEEAIKAKTEIEYFLKEKLKLSLNKKTNYFKNKQGVSFCGYHIYINKIVLLNQNRKKIYKRVRHWNYLYSKGELNLFEAAQSLIAWEGHARIANSYGYIQKIKKKCDWYYKGEIT